MGRKKITITPISNEKQRNITFNKRKNGLLKKAAELSLLCQLKLFLAFTDLNGNLINFYTPDCEFLNEFDFSKDDKKLITFTEKDYPDFFKVNHYKKRSESDYPGSLFKQPNSRAFLGFKRHKYVPKHPAPAPEPLIMKKFEETKEKIFEEPKDDKPIKKPLKKQLTIKIPEKNKSLEFEMNVLKKVNTMKPDEFLNQPSIKENESSSFKDTQMLSSRTDAIMKNEPIDPLLSLEKNLMRSKNPGETNFINSLLSNNKALQNLESAQNAQYFPLPNLTSKEVLFPEDQLKGLDSKNARNDLANTNNRPLNFNEFLQLFTMNNSGGDDYLRFLNLNSSRMSAAGLNTGRLGFPNLTSQGMNAANRNNLNSEIEKNNKEKEEKEEKEEEGDIIKKKRKIE